MTDATSEVTDVARRFFTALSQGDADTVTALAANDFELHLPTAPRGVPRLISGRDQLGGMIANIGDTFTGITVEITRADAFAGDPDRGVLQTEVSATNRDGSTYRNRYLILVELSGGRVRRWSEWYDPAPMAGALDALRAALKAGAGR